MTKSSRKARAGPQASELMLRCPQGQDLSDARLPADLRKSVTDNIEIMPQLVQGFGYALGVFQDLNTTCVWIILHSKWALNCFGKFSIKKRKQIKGNQYPEWGAGAGNDEN